MPDDIALKVTNDLKDFYKIMMDAEPNEYMSSCLNSMLVGKTPAKESNLDVEMSLRNSRG